MKTIKIIIKNNTSLNLNNSFRPFYVSLMTMTLTPISQTKKLFTPNPLRLFLSWFQLPAPYLFQLLIGILLTVIFFCLPIRAFADTSVTNAKPVSMLNFTPAEQTWINEHPIVVYGGGSDWYPHEYIDESGTYSGISLAYLDKVSELTGIKFQPIYLTWQEMIDKTKAGDIDLMLSIAKTPERKPFFRFTKPHSKSIFHFFAKTNFSANDDLSGVSIILINGYAVNQTVIRQFPTATIIEVETWLEGLKLVQSGKADIFIESSGSASYHLDKHGIDNIVPYLPSKLNYPLDYHMATNINNAPLISIINKSLEHISKEDKAIIDKKWSPSSFDAHHKLDNKKAKINYTDLEKQWLKKHPIITYSGSTDWRPLGYYNTQGEYEGIMKDFLQVIDKSIQDSLLDYVATEVVEDTLNKMKKDEVHLIPAPLVTDNLDNYLLTDDIVSTPIVISMTDKQTHYVENLNKLKGKKIAVDSRLLTHTQLEKKFPTLNFIATKSLQEGLEGVSSGKYDACLATNLTTKYTLMEGAFTNVRIVGTTGIQFPLKMAVHKRNMPLVSIVNKSNAIISQEQRQKILKEWVQDSILTKKETDYTLLWQVIIAGGVLFLTIFFIIWLWNRFLAQEVELRKQSEQKLKSANHQLELATNTVGLVIWEVVFPKGSHKEPLTIDSDELDNIIVYDDKKFFEQPKTNIQASNANNTDTDNEKSINGSLTLRQWLVTVVDKETVLDNFNDIRTTKKRRHLEVELYDKSRVYDDISDARKIIFASISYDDSQKQEKIVGTKWDITKIKQNEQALLKNEQALLLSNKRIDSARQQAEEAKKQADTANQAKSDFLANMSHEIRTPLNVILGYTELLNEKSVDSSQKKILTTINSAGKDLLVLVNDILDISKIEAGKLDITLKPCNIYGLMETTSNIFKLSFSEKDLDFQLVYNPKIPSSLFLDEQRIRQVLVNLMGNAIKFTPAGCITMKAELLLNNVHESKVDIAIEISDTGIGIAEQHLSSIFNKFEQVDSKSTREFDGAGLGLAICQRLADMMEGELSVSSTVGSGSTFRLTLKNINIATLASAGTDRQEFLNISNIEFEPATIMTVDDIKDNRDLIIDVFENTNLKVLSAQNGTEALEIIESQKVDFIFMDIYMPEMDGYHTTKAIKAKYDIPITVLTASLMGEHDLENHQIFDGFLNKPALKSELYQEIMKYLPFIYKDEAGGDTNQSDAVSIEQVENEKKHLPVIIAFLEELQPESQVLLKANDMKSTKEFVAKIKGLMDNYPIKSVIHYIEVFEDSLSNVSIKGIRQSLTDFDKLLNKLKKSHRD